MTRTGRPRSLLETHRLAACLVAVFWCAAPVLAAIHASAQVHRYCSEHARLEESDQTPTGAQVAGGPSARSDSERLPAHDSCAFAPVCRFGQVQAAVVLDPTGILAATPFAPPARLEPAPPVALLLIAPKTSPPA
jgi:hypothetical protein